jgi:Gas vesicle protein
MAGNAPMPGAGAAQRYGAPSPVAAGGGRTTNLGDILERVLDKGLVIAGDIQVNLLDIELLTIKLRLVIASLDTARQVGINWWESDPWLNAEAGRRAADGKSARGEVDDGDANGKLREENRRLRDRISELESGQ